MIVAVALYNLGVMDDCYILWLFVCHFIYIVIRDISYTHAHTRRERHSILIFIHAFKNTTHSRLNHIHGCPFARAIPCSVSLSLLRAKTQDLILLIAVIPPFFTAQAECNYSRFWFFDDLTLFTWKRQLLHVEVTRAKGRNFIWLARVWCSVH